MQNIDHYSKIKNVIHYNNFALNSTSKREMFERTERYRKLDKVISIENHYNYLHQCRRVILYIQN